MSIRRFITLIAVTAIGCLGVASAQAASIGGTNCSITANFPGIGNGWWQGQAVMNCSLPHSDTVEVCVQDEQGSTWHNYACNTQSGYDSYRKVTKNFYPNSVSNRNWRMWAWANVGGGHSGYTWSGSRYL